MQKPTNMETIETTMEMDSWSFEKIHESDEGSKNDKNKMREFKNHPSQDWNMISQHILQPLKG